MDQQQDFTGLILQRLNEAEQLDSQQLSVQFGINHQTLVGYLLKLESAEYIKTQSVVSTKFILTEEGKNYFETNSPEFLVYQQVPPEGILIAELEKKLPGVYKIGFSNAMSQKLLENKKGTLFRLVQDAQDAVKLQLEQIHKGEDVTKDQLQNLKKRKLVEESKVTKFTIIKGPKYQVQFKKQLADLTPELIASGQWRNEDFKEINLKAQGKLISTGNLHPLLKARKQFIQVLLQMGFDEMPTNQFVESSFWNFDALFQPQQHPARDAHDTFFCNDPELSTPGDKELWDKVKTMHETGGAGSIGYNYNWSEHEARKNIFRTHTTAVSTKMLFIIAKEYKEKGYFPKKYFSIDRVFRNETLDATHLAEFHQVEGVVIDKNANLGTLMGIIREFFRKIGITKLWFKPTYNPYTEPSMEVYGFHPILKRKVEIGNSGIFRPEMLEPLGIPKDINVMAWGLSLERPTMIYYNVDDIRSMIGHEVEVKTVRQNPFCIFK